MKFFMLIVCLAPPLSLLPVENKGESPADHLPAHITRLTMFGERADFSHDGKRILFLEKTFGQVFEIEVATINDGEDACPTAIGNFQEQGTIALLRILGAKGDEIGTELDFTALQVHCVTEIDDTPVVRIGDSGRKVDAPHNALIRSCVTEFLPLQNVSAGRDLNTADARLERRRD